MSIIPAALTLFAGCSKKSSNATVAVTDITLNKTALTLAAGGEETLTATVASANATDKTVTWTTSDASKATVTADKVTAVTTMPTKTAYSVGDRFDGTGMVVTVTYNNGSTGPANPMFLMVVSYDFSTTGTKTVILSYQSKITSITVTVTGYAVGSLYNQNGVKGIVYKVSNGGVNGMLVSLTEIACTDEPTANNWRNAFNTGSITGWHLPTRSELGDLYTNKTAVNMVLANNGGTQLASDQYWSSDWDFAEPAYYCINLSNGSQSYGYGTTPRVRAVRAF